jgi:hypothetical protein
MPTEIWNDLSIALSGQILDVTVQGLNPLAEPFHPFGISIPKAGLASTPPITSHLSPITSHLSPLTPRRLPPVDLSTRSPYHPPWTCSRH